MDTNTQPTIWEVPDDVWTCIEPILTELYPAKPKANMANTSFTSVGSYADSRMVCQLIECRLPRGFENMKPSSGKRLHGPART